MLADLGEPAYRSRQVYEALTRGFVDGLRRGDDAARGAAAGAGGAPAPAVSRRSGDAGRAARRRAQDAVPHRRRGAGGGRAHDVRARATVCVSTQVGCAVRCAFCASGRLGLRRDLTAEEIVDQVLHFARALRPADRRVTNVVFMGMGEPFHNYDETLRACRMLNDEDGFGLAARAISVSTVGVVPGMDRFVGGARAVQPGGEPARRHRRAARHARAAEPHLPARRAVRGERALRAPHASQAHVRVRGAARRQRHRRAGADARRPRAAAALPPQPDRLQRDRGRLQAADGRPTWTICAPGSSRWA